eukprot:17579-Heterococcus_DN1.PRE.2
MGSATAALLCVFDGHGEHGDKVSNFAMLEMSTRLALHPSIITDPAKALKECFVAINSALSDMGETPLYSGSTAVVVLIRDGQMWSANAGDSRAILATTGDTDTTTSQLQLVALTTDHNPDLPTEKARIVAAGGFVSPPPEPGLSARVWLDPQVWEFLSSVEVMVLVQEELQKGKGSATAATAACETLIARAANKWQAQEGDYRDGVLAALATCSADSVTKLICACYQQSLLLKTIEILQTSLSYKAGIPHSHDVRSDGQYHFK